MRVLVTGRGTSGSWRIRGEQLGRALGATVQPQALDVAAHDLVVLVKRPTPDLVERVHRAGVPLVWDVVDAWPQPDGNDWGRQACMGWLRKQVTDIRPSAIVAATEAMAVDCVEFGLPVLALPHHARPGQAVNPIRPTVRRLGYEGGVQHLGTWLSWLMAQAASRGWEFVANPPGGLADLDIVVALRERTGYAPRNWKSNVKLGNAQATGTPIVCAREAGYRETGDAGIKWADTPDEVRMALDALTSQEARQQAAAQLRPQAPALETVAVRYAEWLERVRCETAGNS